MTEVGWGTARGGPELAERGPGGRCSGGGVVGGVSGAGFRRFSRQRPRPRVTVCAGTARAPGAGGSPAPPPARPEERTPAAQVLREARAGGCGVRARSRAGRRMLRARAQAWSARAGRALGARRPVLPALAVGPACSAPPSPPPVQGGTRASPARRLMPPDAFLPGARGARRSEPPHLSLPQGPASWGLRAAPTLARHRRTPRPLGGMGRTAWTRCWRPGPVSRRTCSSGWKAGDPRPTHPTPGALGAPPSPVPGPFVSQPRGGGALARRVPEIAWNPALCCSSLLSGPTPRRRKLSAKVLSAFHACPGKSAALTQARAVCS